MSSYVRVEEEREGRGERAMKILKNIFPRPGATTAETPTALTGSHAAKSTKSERANFKSPS